MRGKYRRCTCIRVGASAQVFSTRVLCTRARVRGEPCFTSASGCSVTGVAAQCHRSCTTAKGDANEHVGVYGNRYTLCVHRPRRKQRQPWHALSLPFSSASPVERRNSKRKGQCAFSLCSVPDYHHIQPCRQGERNCRHTIEDSSHTFPKRYFLLSLASSLPTFVFLSA